MPGPCLFWARSICNSWDCFFLNWPIQEDIFFSKNFFCCQIVSSKKISGTKFLETGLGHEFFPLPLVGGFFPTPLKNMRTVNMGSSSPIFGVKINKYLSCHHLVFPKIWVPPKSSILVGFSIIRLSILGVKSPYFWKPPPSLPHSLGMVPPQHPSHPGCGFDRVSSPPGWRHESIFSGPGNPNVFQNPFFQWLLKWFPSWGW